MNFLPFASIKGRQGEFLVTNLNFGGTPLGFGRVWSALFLEYATPFGNAGAPKTDGLLLSI